LWFVVCGSWFVVCCSSVVANGGCDWNAGVPACNAVASAASNLSDLKPLITIT
jgi:hypothetical protein